MKLPWNKKPQRVDEDEPSVATGEDALQRLKRLKTRYELQSDELAWQLDTEKENRAPAEPKHNPPAPEEEIRDEAPLLKVELSEERHLQEGRRAMADFPISQQIDHLLETFDKRPTNKKVSSGPLQDTDEEEAPDGGGFLLEAPATSKPDPNFPATEEQPILADPTEQPSDLEVLSEIHSVLQSEQLKTENAAFASPPPEPEANRKTVIVSDPKMAEEKPLESEKFETEHEAISRLINNSRIVGGPYEKCLRVLLLELNWPGEDRHIMESMPHFRDLDNPLLFRGVLHHLGFETWITEISAKLLPGRLPCVLIQDEASPTIALRLVGKNKLLIFEGKTGQTKQIDIAEKAFEICVVEKTEVTTELTQARKTSWFFDGFLKFKSKIWIVVLLTFVANILGLATPIFTMNVYNLVIESKSLDTLLFFLSAMLATLVFELYLRRNRGRLIAYIGSRFNTQLLIAAFKRIVGLPISMTESASVSQQIVRLRQFENLQVFFAGPVVSAVLDLPFILVFIVAVTMIHPLLAAIPVALAIVFLIVGLISMPVTRRNVTVTGRSRQTQQNLLIETVNKRESVRQVRGEEVWIKRWSTIGNDFVSKRFNAQFFDMIMYTISQSLVMAAGVATLWIGTFLVIDQALSIGALIAVMMFVWRILAPIQTAFLSMNRVGQLLETARQADLLMSIPPENQSKEAPTLRRNYRGHIVLNNVNFRYGQSGDPVFRGINVNINPGEVVAVTGEAACGKSSFLKLILGLYRPQSGNVYIDGLNLQQLDLDEVRTSIGYVAQRQNFFYGTLAQNIRLSSPSATDEEIEKALGDVGIWLPHPQLEEGIKTRLTGRKLSNMPNPLKQAISLARAFVKSGSIYLLDTPNHYFNEFEECSLFDQIQSLRGRATVIIATESEAMIRQCDRVLYIHNGAITFDNTPENYLKAQENAAKSRHAQ